MAISELKGNKINDIDHYKDALAKAGKELSIMKVELEEKTRALSDINEELKSLDKMKNEFIQNISRELRTPLTPVIGYLELFLSNDLGDLSGTQKEIMSDMHQCSKKLAFNIDTLLHMVALQDEVGDTSFEEIQLDSIVEYVAQYTREDAECCGLEFEVSYGDGLEPIWGVKGMLTLMINHLVKNAIKFTPKGGKILLSAKLNQDGFIDIVIKDSGMGIDSKKMVEIFEPFFRLDIVATRGFEGIGLGLALVKKIVSMHQGQISIESSENVGTLIKISLPVITNM